MWKKFKNSYSNKLLEFIFFNALINKMWLKHDEIKIEYVSLLNVKLYISKYIVLTSLQLWSKSTARIIHHPQRDAMRTNYFNLHLLAREFRGCSAV